MLQHPRRHPVEVLKYQWGDAMALKGELQVLDCVNHVTIYYAWIA